VKLCMIGLGRLGLPCAEALASAHDVAAFDVALRQSDKVRVCSTLIEAVVGRDVIFIAVQTPHDPAYGGETPTTHLPARDFDYAYVAAVLRDISPHLSGHERVVLISTVLPGTIRRDLVQLIDVPLIYNPYLIAMGTVAWDMVNPEMIICGSSEGASEDFAVLREVYDPIMQNAPRWVTGTWEEAEATKIFYNTFISAKISLVNMVQDVAERIGHMNVDIVTTALAESTHRIMGPAYMKAAMGDGGACHPRDNIALRYLSETLDLGYDLFGSIAQSRDIQARNMAKALLGYGRVVVILGKAYKPRVPYIDGSASLLVAHFIEQLGGKAHFVDPNTGDDDHPDIDGLVYLIGYIEDWVETFNFRNNSVVVDPWRQVRVDNQTIQTIYYGNTRNRTKYQPLASSMLPEHIPIEYVPLALDSLDDGFRISSNLLSEEDNGPFTDWNTSAGPASGIGLAFPVSARTASASNVPFAYEIYPYGFMDDSLARAQFPLAIPGHVISAIRRGQAVLVINALAEGDPPLLAFELIHRHISALGIPLHQTILATGNQLAPALYKKWYGSSPDTIHVVAGDVWRDEMAWHMHSFPDNFVNYEQAKTQLVRPRHILCLNRRPRDHRIALVARLIRAGLVDKCLLSMSNSTKDDLDYSRHLSHETPISADVRTIWPFVPIVVDRSDFETNHVFEHAPSLYLNSYLSVVTETLFFETHGRTRFVSEKIYKPIAQHHPFIVVGCPGTLQYIRSLGFQTFNGDLIDESYDTISNDQERMAAIMQNIERVCSMSLSDMADWYQDQLPVLRHNADLLRNMSMSASGPLRSTIETIFAEWRAAGVARISS